MARQEAKELLLSLEDGKPRASHEVTSIIHLALQRLEPAGADEAEKAPWIYEVCLWTASPQAALTRRSELERPLALSDRFGERAKWVCRTVLTTSAMGSTQL